MTEQESEPSEREKTIFDTEGNPLRKGFYRVETLYLPWNIYIDNLKIRVRDNYNQREALSLQIGTPYITFIKIDNYIGELFIDHPQKRGFQRMSEREVKDWSSQFKKKREILEKLIEFAEHELKEK